jgi:hypothetical protein
MVIFLDRIEKNRYSKSSFWRFLCWGKDFIWWNLIGFRQNILPVPTDQFRQAINEGRKIDLTGCCYGEGHNFSSGGVYHYIEEKFIDNPSSYYYFLAGLVKSQQLSSILELGTHYGGATMSMSGGISKNKIKESCIVTVDITNKNVEEFKKYPNIKRIQGSDIDEKVAKKVIASFDKPIDLLYIDSNHMYEHVMKILALYATKLNPKFIVLDDIHLVPSMDRLWRKIKAEFGDRAFDVSEVAQRGRNIGMGVVLWDDVIGKRFLAK